MLVLTNDTCVFSFHSSIIIIIFILEMKYGLNIYMCVCVLQVWTILDMLDLGISHRCIRELCSLLVLWNECGRRIVALWCHIDPMGGTYVLRICRGHPCVLVFPPPLHGGGLQSHPFVVFVWLLSLCLHSSFGTSTHSILLTMLTLWHCIYKQEIIERL